jgi:hypothetical protein
MKKKDIYFACLFMVCFLVSALVMAGDYFAKTLEKDWGTHQEPQVQGSEANDSSQTEQESEVFLDGATEESETQEITEIKENTETPDHTEVPGSTENQEDVEIPAEEESKFQTVERDYFDDALFVGDSRTVGLMEYGNLENATFFADSGMSVYGLALKKITIPGKGKMTFDQVLDERQYGKIYLMLGVNELGYRFETTKARFEETVEKIHAAQPEAIIYLCANMHVTKEQSEKDEIYNNTNVNMINEVIEALADDQQFIYLDVNELFDDEEGYLNEEYTSDAFHVLGKYYEDWVDWLCTKAIIQEVDDLESGD